MRFGKLSLAAIAAASLVSAPVMAQSLSPTAKVVGASKVKRVGAKTKEENKMLNLSPMTGGLVLGGAAVIAFVIARNNRNTPTSP